MCALMIRQPAEIMGYIIHSQIDEKELVFDPETAKVWRALVATHAKNGELNRNNLARMVPSPRLEEVCHIAESPDLFDVNEIMEEVVMWRGLRAIDQAQRDWAAWRRTGILDPISYQEAIARIEQVTTNAFHTLARDDADVETDFYKGTFMPFSTGFPWLDRLLHGGWRVGDMEVVAGHAKGGKTILQANAAARQLVLGRVSLAVQREIAEQKFRDLILSAMLTRPEIGCPIPFDRIEKREIADNEREKVAECFNLMRLGLKISTSIYTVPQIRAWARVKLTETGRSPETLLQVDHLNLLMLDKSAGLAAGLSMENIGYALHDLSNPDSRVGLGLPILLTAQLDDAAGRILKSKGKLKPEEFKVRGCRAVEMFVDTAFSLGRSKTEVSSSAFQKHIDRNGDGSDNHPVSVLYNHSLRAFVE